MRQNVKESVLVLLQRYTSVNQIIIDDHTLLQINQRNIRIEEIVDNILNPKRLEIAIQQEGNAKYDCYFVYSKTLCHKYILKIHEYVIVVTAIKINKRWQRKAEKQLRKSQ